MKTLEAFRAKYPLTQADVDDSTRVIGTNLTLGTSFFLKCKTEYGRKETAKIMQIERLTLQALRSAKV